MSEQGTESLAAILAEFRKFALRAAEEDKMISPESVLLLVDKVEAAVERERREYERMHECFWKEGTIQNFVRQLLDHSDDIRDAKPELAEAIRHFAQELIKAATPSTGNAAAMRAALEKFLDFSRRGLAFVTSYRYTDAENEEIEAAFDAAKSAIAEPARNCDRPFRSVDEALGAYVTERGDGPHLGYCDAIKWALAPAKGGAE